MKFECKDLERALEVPELLADAREHARDCKACSRGLWIWGEMSQAAPALREEWDTPQLWQQIRHKLEAEPKRVEVRRWNWRSLSAIAAALVLMAGSVLWYALRPVPEMQQAGGDFLTEQTLKEVEQAEAAYVKSIGKLSQLAEAKLQKPDSALTAAYREKLQLLDSGIAELRANVAQNRFNTRLQTELAALYKQKQETLQEIVRREQKN